MAIQAFSDSLWMLQSPNYATESKEIAITSPSYSANDIDATTGENRYELRRSIYHVTSVQKSATAAMSTLGAYLTTANITPPTYLLPYNGSTTSTAPTDSVPTGTNWLWQVESFQISHEGGGVSNYTLQVKGTGPWAKRAIAT